MRSARCSDSKTPEVPESVHFRLFNEVLARCGVFIDFSNGWDVRSCFFSFRIGVPSGDDVPTPCIEVSQNVSRLCLPKTSIPCITGSSKRWLPKRCRLMHGGEALRVQGMNFSSEVLRSVPLGVLDSLAGNAFHSGRAAAVAAAHLAIVARIEGIGSLRKSRPPRGISCDGVEEEETCDLDSLLGLA